MKRCDWHQWSNGHSVQGCDQSCEVYHSWSQYASMQASVTEGAGLFIRDGRHLGGYSVDVGCQRHPMASCQQIMSIES